MNNIKTEVHMHTFKILQLKATSGALKLRNNQSAEKPKERPKCDTTRLKHDKIKLKQNKVPEDTRNNKR